MGLSLAGIGLGGLALAPLADLLIARLGWRLAYAALACLFLPMIAVILAVVRTHPAELGLRPDGLPTPSETDDDAPAQLDAVENTTRGLGLGEALRTRAFWIISLCNLLLVFGGFSIVTHLVAYLTDQGFGSRTAAVSLGLMIGASVAGRLLFGFLADHVPKARVLSLVLGLLTGCTLLLFRVQSAGMLPAFLLSFGVAFGGGAVLIPLLVGECFGLRFFGRILGLTMISATLGGAIGPVLTGRIYDVTGSYQLAFVMHTVGFGLAAVVAYFLRPSTRAGGLE